ncbi:ABC transporter substrate-binding protein [Aquabacterium sp.]|uniref:ABC transporter substrate-binding protein n=1 Tax=Aquabacterium sp. TaxID=1872578 RepID=UPI0027BAFC89|nr:helical backbone metal receptor [Aquabacterium sp.]
MTMGWSFWFRVLVMWWLCLTLSVPAHAAISVVDDQGAKVTLAAPPQRIVSLLPSLTESVCVLGACGRLVATDRWSNWPESVRQLPKLGGLDDANLELILAQRPDLVLLSSSNRLAARLRALGLTVAELDAEDLPQVQRLLTKVAALLGVPQQAAVQWQVIESDIRKAQALVPPSARGTRVYFEVSSALYAAGESSYIGQLLTRLGAVNVVSAQWGPFPKLNPEFVVRAQPDLIMLSATEAEGLVRRPGWSQMKAVRHGRICAMPPVEYDVLSRPGPRLGAAAQVLARCLASAGGRR